MGLSLQSSFQSLAVLKLLKRWGSRNLQLLWKRFALTMSAHLLSTAQKMAIKVAFKVSIEDAIRVPIKVLPPLLQPTADIRSRAAGHLVHSKDEHVNTYYQIWRIIQPVLFTFMM